MRDFIYDCGEIPQVEKTSQQSKEVKNKITGRVLAGRDNGLCLLSKSDGGFFRCWRTTIQQAVDDRAFAGVFILRPADLVDLLFPYREDLS